MRCVEISTIAIMNTSSKTSQTRERKAKVTSAQRVPVHQPRKRNTLDIKRMYPRKVNSEIVNMLPISSYTGEIVLVEDDAHLDVALPEIMQETVLGFDTETRPNFSKDRHYLVSILQLGGRDKVWIIRLEPLKHRLSDIYEVLENPAIKKVGVAVHGDILSLKERCEFSPAGFEDIAKFTKGIGVINTGMKNLAALILGERISKAAQLTNWASDNLTKKQLEYAATDAWISRRLYISIKKHVETTNIGIEPEEPEKVLVRLKKFVSNVIKKITPKSSKKKAPQKKKKDGQEQTPKSEKKFDRKADKKTDKKFDKKPPRKKVGKSK